MNIRNAVVVYQAGIANVFDVTEGKRARVLQSSFDACEWFAAGLIAAGTVVSVSACNRAGDIAALPWVTPLSDAPFNVTARPFVRRLNGECIDCETGAPLDLAGRCAECADASHDCDSPSCARC